jgi:carbonic anhydrase
MAAGMRGMAALLFVLAAGQVLANNDLRLADSIVDLEGQVGVSNVAKTAQTKPTLGVAGAQATQTNLASLPVVSAIKTIQKEQTELQSIQSKLAANLKAEVKKQVLASKAAKSKPAPKKPAPKVLKVKGSVARKDPGANKDHKGDTCTAGRGFGYRKRCYLIKGCRYRTHIGCYCPKGRKCLKYANDYKRDWKANWLPEKEWGFKKEDGPFYWWKTYTTKKGELKPVEKGATYPPSEGMCNGAEQSPIDIRTSTAKRGRKVEFVPNWPNTTGFYFNHTKNFFFLEGLGFDNASTQFETSTYKLEYVSFHKPAEHSINTELFPMELQFVHKAAKHPDGSFGPLIVSVLYSLSDEGAERGIWNVKEEDPQFKRESVGNPVLEKDLNWLNLPKEGEIADILGRCCQTCPDNKKPSPEVVGCKFFDPKELLPLEAGLDYYQYRGSLTYPPCTENVQWLVLKHHPIFTYEQLEALPVDRNYRPVALNKNRDNVMLNSGAPPPVKRKAAPAHEQVDDCGPSGQNCAGDEFFAMGRR